MRKKVKEVSKFKNNTHHRKAQLLHISLIQWSPEAQNILNIFLSLLLGILLKKVLKI